MNNLIEIKNLCKSFPNNTVLNGIDLSIKKGSIVSILGKSGTGKSVLIKCVIGLLKADSGMIIYNGYDLLKTSTKKKIELHKDFAYLFQESALFDSLNVYENIAFPIREVLGIKNKEYIRNRVRELLNWVGLPNTEHLRPSELSGGMKKRTSFARTLAINPKIMLCDEPTTGLDPVTGKTIMDLIVKANKDLRITCIIISHDVPESFRVSDEIAFLNDGKIRAMGNQLDVSQTQDETLQQFIKNAFVSREELEHKQI